MTSKNKIAKFLKWIVSKIKIMTFVLWIKLPKKLAKRGYQKSKVIIPIAQNSTEFRNLKIFFAKNIVKVITFDSWDPNSETCSM
jgi:hypothetical protein